MKRKYLVAINCCGTVCGMLTVAGIAWLVAYHHYKPQIFAVSDDLHPCELTIMVNKATKVLGLFDPSGVMVDQTSLVMG